MITLPESFTGLSRSGHGNRSGRDACQFLVEEVKAQEHSLFSLLCPGEHMGPQNGGAMLPRGTQCR